jgi:hypothetical protein
MFSLHMANKKCEICKEDIILGFMDKPRGTIVKVKDDEKNNFIHICRDCQKKFGDGLMAELGK